jgi:SAM-dependent methyltransferase
MERLAFPPASFDAVLCGFGLFFAANMEALIRTLWRLLRPGGRLGITTWGGDAFEPAHSGAFAPSLAAEAPALAALPEPWRRADTPSDMSALLRGADIPAEIIEVRSSFLLRGPEDWWTIVIGIGTRWYIEQMDPATRERVRIANLRWIEQHRLRAIAMDVVYSIACKPSQARS